MTDYKVLGYTQRRDPDREFALQDFGFTFTDKESYLEWVNAWKTEYKSLSESIRNHKEICSTMQREGHIEASKTQRTLVALGAYARGMLIARKYAKAHSWALKQASAVAA